jgi:hypothetical protein
MGLLGTEERNQLALDLQRADFEAHVEAEQMAPLAALLTFEQAIWRVSRAGLAGLVFSGQVRVGPHGVPAWVGQGEGEHHYLLSHVGKELRSSEIDPGLSQLYELQGLPAMRMPA